MDDKQLKEELGQEPIVKIYVNKEFAFACGEVKGDITIFRPDVNCKITVSYMSDEEWEEINESDEDAEKRAA